MLEAIIYSFISVFFVSITSLIGVFTLSIKEEKLKKVVFFLVSFSAGVLLGGAFLHLIPEAIESVENTINFSLFILLGIITFFILEKFIHWRHCHKIGRCEVHDSKDPRGIAKMILFGDAIHNLIDGMIIAGSYIVDLNLGIVTTIAVLFHELPQEIGDFGILISSGYKRVKALFLNFISALFAFLGCTISLIVSNSVEGYLAFLIPFTAGGFIYIATADLIPELQKEKRPLYSILQLFSFIFGILLMLAFVFFE